MEHLSWISVDPISNIVNMSSVDAMAVIHILKGRDFQIVEMRGLNKDLLWKNEERFWIVKDHYVEISSLIEKDEFENIYEININLNNNDSVNFCYGQLSFRMSDSKLLKNCSIKILEQYGYFAADKIWNLISRKRCSVPIYYVLGMQEKDLGNEFYNIVEKGLY